MTALPLLLIGLVLSYILVNDFLTQKKYDDTKARCGYEPIASTYDTFFKQYETLRVGAVPSTYKDKYYCTYSEALTDGHTKEEIDTLRQEIQNDKNIPASVKDQY